MPSSPLSEITSILRRFLRAPAKKPRTLCGCQSVTSMISAIEAPFCRRSKPRTRACLVSGFFAGAALRVLRPLLVLIGLLAMIGLPCRRAWRNCLASCLLYTSDAADDLLFVDLGGRHIIKQ